MVNTWMAMVAAAATTGLLFILVRTWGARARELEAANARLARSEARLAGFIISAHDAIVSVDDTGRIQLFNPAAERMTGWRGNEVAGRAGIDLLIPERHRDTVFGIIRDFQRSGESRRHSGEVTAQRRDGSEFVVEISISRHESAGRPHFTVIARDVTDRKLAQAQARRMSEELERRVASRTAELTAIVAELEAFTYTVSHDLRAPLRAIDGFTQVLMQDHVPMLDAEAQRLLGRVSFSARHMAALIDGLLALSRAGRSDIARRPFETMRVAREAAVNAAEEFPGVDYEVGVLPPAVGDDKLVGQVFANLVQNAFKFTCGREGAFVRIGATVEEGRAPVYFVEDNGIGFDMAHAGKLFGVFQRLRTGNPYPGTGVGLAIVKRIVERHGGRAWVHAEPGKGARFSFTLRADVEAAIQAPQREQEQE